LNNRFDDLPGEGKFRAAKVTKKKRTICPETPIGKG
jgi:hypothetical protein